MTSSRNDDVDDSSPAAPRADLHLVELADAQRIAYLTEELAQRDLQIDNLEIALSTSRRIGAAIGIVMFASKITEEDAFEILVRASQRAHRKLRDVADNLVETGALE